jgi:hypothetical protein
MPNYGSDKIFLSFLFCFFIFIPALSGFCLFSWREVDDKVHIYGKREGLLINHFPLAIFGIKVIC